MSIEKKMDYFVNEDSGDIGFSIPPSLLLDGKITLASFLRDYLYAFAFIVNDAPQHYYIVANKDSDKAQEMFKEDLEALSSQFGYIAEYAADSNVDINPYITTAFSKLIKIFKYLYW